MVRFLDTTGNAPLSIGICGRCKLKYPLGELMPDPNAPGLFVCRDDIDQFDPYRLAARQLERIVVDNPRPDDPMAPGGPVPLYTPNLGDITQLAVTVPWSRLTPYAKGATVTPLDVNLEATTLPQNEFVARNAGTSGSASPTWPAEPGQIVTDGSIVWINLGIYPN